VPLGGKGFVLFGHEGSCQLLSIRVSTAVTTAAYTKTKVGRYHGALGEI
jgi:hypothetical protein